MAFPDSRVRLLRMPERGGKTYAQNQGVRHAQGEIIVFSDATAIYHQKAFAYLACNYRIQPSARSVAGINTLILAIIANRAGQRCILNYENMVKKLQSRCAPSPVVVGASIPCASRLTPDFGRRCH